VWVRDGTATETPSPYDRARAHTDHSEPARPNDDEPTRPNDGGRVRHRARTGEYDSAPPETAQDTESDRNTR
jgi:hypothetical protein